MTRQPKRIDVTQPYLPPLDEFTPYLERIWASHQLSNGGALHAELEDALARYLGVEHLSLLSNGTLGLLIALRALGIEGEVVTTPFSFVASTSALQWMGITPVFADIDEQTFNLDPARVDAAITPATRAILAVHAYGQSADVDALQAIADRHGVKLIYDAAHSFGVRDGAGSILRHGDMSVLSFHATKVFTTFEGGAIVCRDRAMKERVDRLKNFGLAANGAIEDCGINAKMNEVQAAFGLVQLRHVDRAIAMRRRIDERYRSGLAEVTGVRPLPLLPGVAQNYSYFPVVIEDSFGETRDQLMARLQIHQVFTRRYFYPLLSNIAPCRDLPSAAPALLPIANLCAERVLCLPISPNLRLEEIDFIVELIAAGRQ